MSTQKKDKEVLHIKIGKIKRASELNRDEYATNILDKDGHLIAKTIYSPYYDVDEAEANAELICKAVNEYEDLQREKRMRISYEESHDKLKIERQRLLTYVDELARTILTDKEWDESYQGMYEHDKLIFIGSKFKRLLDSNRVLVQALEALKIDAEQSLSKSDRIKRFNNWQTAINNAKNIQSCT